MEQFKCPKCGSKMVPMRQGNGWRCGTPGNRFTGSGWTICDGVIWNKKFERPQRIQTPRPLNWLAIRQRTEEQTQLRRDLGQSPDSRGGRCMIWDAGPGTGKSTTIADCCESVYQRVGRTALTGWYLCAFNVNARVSLEGKLPADWPNIYTINSFGARIQGFNPRNYKPGKMLTMFKEMTQGIPEKERPNFGPLRAFGERARDQLLIHHDENNQNHWHGMIAALISRFPALGKKLNNNPKAEETVRDYLPKLLVRAQKDRSFIDINEQYTRCGTDATMRTKPLDLRLVDRGATWTDEDVQAFANLVRSVNLPQVQGVIVDEAQDLSLAQLLLFLAVTWRSGELILVGDDFSEEPYKAGQAIFGWRGAFPGVLSFIGRIWHALTGETPIRRSLSVTHRCPPEVVKAVRGLNSVLKSAKPKGSGEVMACSPDQAFTRWLDLPDKDKEGRPYKALWITRRNAPLATVFMQTLKARRKVCLRGGNDIKASIDRALFEAAGWYDDNEEYKIPLRDALANLRAQAATEEAGADNESFESFLLEVGEEILREPSILAEAELPPLPTVGNLRRFVVYFADRDAPRVLSTVYRSKGDEAPLVIVDDTEMLNTAWNGDAQEAAACRHVACTRSSETLLLLGPLLGVEIPAVRAEDEEPTPAAPAKKPRKARKAV